MVMLAENRREGGAMATAQDASSPIGKRVVLGGGLLVLAFVLWELRDAVPGWLAKSVTTTVEFSTTAERDDARVTRAFEAARQTLAADAILETLPNQTQVRHTRLTVVAPTEDSAVALATRMSEAMQRAFVREGGSELLANVRRRATPVADRTTETVSQALRIGVAVFAILGVVLIALGVIRLQAGADRLPTPIWWGIGFGIAIPVATTLLPGAVVATLLRGSATVLDGKVVDR